MKKIIGIFGLTLVLAISFFNMTSVVTANQNVDLASIIQISSANAEIEDDGVEYVEDFDDSGDYFTEDGCHITWGLSGSDCRGIGEVECEAIFAVHNIIDC